MARSPHPRLRLLLKAALSLAIATVALELGVRFLAFNEVAASWSVSQPLRRAGRYGDVTSQTYWRLQHHFTAADERLEVPRYDELVGWTGYAIEPGTFAHVHEPSVGDRRPVLLFGDSFAQCNTDPDDCFEGLLDESDLAERYALINYGVGGYGLDQTYLLLKHSIDRWSDRDPIVMVGLLVDDDFDRCDLDFRCWPKPRLVVEGDELVPERPRVPTIEEYYAENPGAWTSYGMSILVMGTPFFPRAVRRAWNDVASAESRKRRRAERILEEMVAELRGRDLEFFFVLFYGEANIANPLNLQWRQELVETAFERLDVPWVSTRRTLFEDSATTRRDLEDYYGGSPRLAGHLNPDGNRAAFAAIRDGIAGLYGTRGTGVPSAAIHEEVRVHGVGGAARYERGERHPFYEEDDRERLCMRVGQGGPTELVYLLERRARAFEAMVRLIPLEGYGPDEGSVGLTFLVDGEERVRRLVRRSDAKLPVAVDLTGSSELVIRVDDAGDGSHGDWLVLSEPRFR